MKEQLIIIDVQNDFENIITDEFKNSINKLCRYSKLTKKNMLFIKSHYFEIPEHKLEQPDLNIISNELDKKDIIEINDIVKINDIIKLKDSRLEGTHQGKKICIKNTYGSELIDLIKPYSNDSNTFVKHYYSGFKETNLDKYLKENNINTLVFSGLTINTCVKATILDGLKLGYNVKIIKECVIGQNNKMTIKGIGELVNYPNVSLITLSEYTNEFEIYCSGDTFILNNVFPQEIYNQDTFNNIINECDWKQMEIQGGQLSRLVDVQALIDYIYSNNKTNKLIPVYRNPSDKYIEPHKPTPTIKKMFDWLNDQIDLDGIKFNHVFLKYYKSCGDGIGKHSDKTLDLNKDSYIGNLSLGSTRKMTFKSKTTPNVINITLKTNSILFIGMETNKKWLHEVKPDLRQDSLKTPDELAYQTQRMSLTFRTACTFFNTQTNMLEGQGAPKIYIDSNDYEKLETDKDNLIKAFGQENKRADFIWNEFYSCGFYSMCT